MQPPRRSLLGGLGGYEGDVVEIISADEWEVLQSSFSGLADSHSVGFSFDDGNGNGNMETITWSCGICTSCDPIAYNNMRRGREGKKRNTPGYHNHRQPGAWDDLNGGHGGHGGGHLMADVRAGVSVFDFEDDGDIGYGGAIGGGDGSGSGGVNGSGSSNGSFLYPLASPATHRMPSDTDFNPRDWETSGDVIVDDLGEYPNLSTTNSTNSNTEGSSVTGTGESANGTPDTPWTSGNIPSPVKRAFSSGSGAGSNSSASTSTSTGSEKWSKGKRSDK